MRSTIRLIGICAFCTATGFVHPTAGATPDVGPLEVVLTVPEKTILRGLTRPSEVARFTALAWARRDPDLSTPDNEQRDRIETMAAIADRLWGHDNVPGWRTDRGRVLVLLGPPEKREAVAVAAYLDSLYRDRPSGGSHEALGGVGYDPMNSTSNTHAAVITMDLTRTVAADAKFLETGAPDEITVRHGVRFRPHRAIAELWRYPAEPPGTGVTTVAFFDHFGESEYSLQTEILGAQSTAKTIANRPSLTLHNEDLDRPPVFPLITGSPQASRGALERLDQEFPRWPVGSSVHAMRGLDRAARFPVWVRAELSDELPTPTRVVGRLILEGGPVFGTFEVSTGQVPGAATEPLELAISAPSNPATIELGFFDGHTPLAATTIAVPPVPLASREGFLTPVAIGGEVEQRDIGARDPPFVFGGYHVDVRPTGRFTADEVLSYFCLLSHLGADPPEAEVRAKLVSQDGAPLGVPIVRTFRPSPAAPGIAMIGSQIPLTGVPVGEPCRLHVTVETAKGVRRSTTHPLLVEPS